MKKKVIGCLIVGGLSVAGITTLAVSDTALLWFVNKAIPGANMTLEDLDAARHAAWSECQSVMAPALKKQCMLRSLNQQMRPTPASDVPPSSDASSGEVLRT
jgi:hypothetical protein